VFDTGGKFISKFGQTGSGDGELLRPAGIARRKERQSDRRRQRQQPPAGLHPEGKFVGKCGGPARPGEFNQPWGITLDKDGNIYVADWKNHRIQKLSARASR
jgi:hypothetical protein